MTKNEQYLAKTPEGRKILAARYASQRAMVRKRNTDLHRAAKGL